MGALTIAFDTTIVGALALPWVLLIIHLFFFDREDGLGNFLGSVKDQLQPAAAGVLLFALTYTLGSMVSRTAQDFFDDDDLHVSVGGHENEQHAQVGGRLFRVGVTEGRLLTRVYCDGSKDGLLVAGKENPELTNAINTFKTFPEREKLCLQTLSWFVGSQTNWQDDKLNQAAEDIVGLQENALMVKGGDYTVRLRQLHDQIMVLRGAAFNGFVGFSLCLFAWGMKLRREKPRSRLVWALVPVPAVYIAVAFIATLHHFEARSPSDPPYMEFTMLLLAVAGAWLVWKPDSSAGNFVAKRSATGEAAAKLDPATPETKCQWRIEHWARLVALSAALTTAAILGWWSTEMLYGQQVIYSYDSQVSQSQGTSASQ